MSLLSPENRREYERIKRLAIPEILRPQRARQHKRKQLKKFGANLESYGKLLKNQNGTCAFTNCFAAPTDLDHNHHTNKLRGLLCRRHNLLLGLARDNHLDLQDAVKYLQLYQ